MLDAYFDAVDRVLMKTNGNEWLPIVLLAWCTPILLPLAIIGMFIPEED